MNDDAVWNPEGVSFSEDPMKHPEIGTTIFFKPTSITFPKNHDAFALSDWGLFQGMLLSLHFVESNHQEVLGSAIIIAPGVALCAKHVVEDKLNGIALGAITAFATGYSPHGADLWMVRAVTTIPDNDVCIISLMRASEMPTENTFHQAVLSTRLPRIGERLTICGFRAAEMKFDFSHDGPIPNKVDGCVIVCSGLVVDRYPSGRDKSMLPWPVVAVQCPSWGGMSGGPVFDQHGKLIGLLASSFGDSVGPSYVSLLWSALAARFTGGWPRSLSDGTKCILELDPKICSVDNREAIQAISSSDNSKREIIYKIWE